MALFVFAALLVVDTGGILGLIFSWAISGPAYRWMLLSALLAIVALYCVRRRQKRPRVSGRAHSLVAPAGVWRPQQPKLKDRRQKSVASRSKR